MRRLGLLGGAIATLLLSACGGDDGFECGAGTEASDGQCVPTSDDQAPTTSISPAPGRVRVMPDEVTLTASEPAAIFYTLDGSAPTTSSRSGGSPVILSNLPAGTEIRFFAVDIAGNEEAVQTAAFDVDAAPPGLVTGLTADRDGTSVDLSWTNPGDSDFAGVIVVRTDNAYPSSPVQGEILAAGDTLPGGESVLAAGDIDSATDTLSEPGVFQYTVWSHDDLGNYALVAAAASVVTPLPDLQARLVVDTENDTVTVASQPTGLEISATVNAAGGNATLEVSVQNNIKRTLFGLAVSGAQLVDEASGVLGGGGGEPTSDDLFESLGEGSTATTTVVVSYTPTDAASVDVVLDFTTSPLLLGDDQTVNTLTGRTGALYGADGFGGRTVTSGPLGLRAIALSKKLHGLQVVDLETRDLLLLAPTPGQVAGVAVMPDGSVVSSGHQFGHWNGGIGGNGNARSAPNQVDLVLHDRLTFEPIASLALGDFETGRIARGLALSNDGRTLAALVSSHIGTLNELWLIDVATFAVIGEPIDLGTVGIASRADIAAWSADDQRLFVGVNLVNRNIGRGLEVPDDLFGRGGTDEPAPILAVDLASGAVTEIAVSGMGDRVGALRVMGDTLLYAATGQNSGRTRGAVAIDLANGNAITEISTQNQVVGLDIDPIAGRLYVRTRNSTIELYSTEDFSRIDLDGEPGNGIQNLSGSQNRHPVGSNMTPF